jgi:protein-tyrosine phosphatase
MDGFDVLETHGVLRGAVGSAARYPRNSDAAETSCRAGTVRGGFERHRTMTTPSKLHTGWVNFRDLGGHPTPAGPTRFGRVFRSDSLAHAGPDHVARLTDELGVRTVVDLRSAKELDELPLDHLRAVGIAVHHTPLFDGLFSQDLAHRVHELTLLDLYDLILEQCAAGLVEAVRVIASDDNHPVVFMCAAGKDRTGVVTALVLASVGVDEESIIADYARSAHAVDEIKARVRSRATGGRVPDQMFGAEGETMRALLANLAARHGSAAEYLLHHGVERRELDALRRSLVDVGD